MLHLAQGLVGAKDDRILDEAVQVMLDLADEPDLFANGEILMNDPIPPSMAMEMAIEASVTVSIAALTNGMLSVMRLVRRPRMSVWSGRKSAYCVINDTSSKVSPLRETAP